MIRFIFFLATILVGCLFEIVLGRYLSLYDAAPQVFLLLTIVNGFLFGPVMGEIFGFTWGLISDATGVRLFGMNANLLALAGFLAGSFRRRVASERLTAQIAISMIGTVYYAMGVSVLYALFEETPGRFSLLHFFLEAIYNAVFIPAFFLFLERWTDFWRVPQADV